MNCFLLSSGYHNLPEQDMSWCTDEDIGVFSVSLGVIQQIQRNKKKYLNMVDNDNLPETEIYT